jgi:phosphopantetheine attachment domain protein
MKQISTDKIFEIVNSILKNSEITKNNVDENIFELGMDSIAFIHIIVALEEEFECEIPDDKLLINEMDTVKKIIDVLQTLYDEQSN